MRRIRTQYTWRELGQYALRATQSLITGVSRLLWAIVLLAVNSARKCALCTLKGIRAYPVAAVAIVAGLLLAVVLFQHVSYKYRLTTAEWKAGQLQMRLDSLRELRDTTATFSRLRPYE